MKRSAPLRRRRALRRKTALVRNAHPSRTWRARPGWWKVRKFTEGRADGLCEANTPACPVGSHRGGQAHHVLPRSQGGPDDPGNLLWVCAAGHEYVHMHPAESYERGWLRRRAAAS